MASESHAAAAADRLEAIWPDEFEGRMTRAGVRWSEMVAHAVFGAHTPETETGLLEALRDAFEEVADRWRDDLGDIHDGWSAEELARAALAVVTNPVTPASSEPNA